MLATFGESPYLLQIETIKMLLNTYFYMKVGGRGREGGRREGEREEEEGREKQRQREIEINLSV